MTFLRSPAVKIWGGLLLLLLLALLVRYQWIQPREMGFLCESAAAPWHCKLREAVIWSYKDNGLGWASLIGGVLAFVSRSRYVAIFGAAAGIGGLVLYCYEFAAVGFALSVLTLARQLAPAREQTGPEDGQGEQHAQQAP